MVSCQLLILGQILDALVTAASADLEIRDKHSRTAAHYAAMLGYEDTLQGIVAHAAANAVDAFGFTPLHYACYNGHDVACCVLSPAHHEQSCVQVLLDDEIQWKPVEPTSAFTPLHCAGYVCSVMAM